MLRTILRVTIGVLFIGHGTQKLFGWFGGSGLGGTAEAVGGALLAAGLATPLAVGALISVMVTAIRTVHLKNGVWTTNGGYEYNLVIIAALLTLAEAGPGPVSIDALIGQDTGSSLRALGLAALGAGASAAAIERARRVEPALVHSGS